MRRIAALAISMLALIGAAVAIDAVPAGADRLTATRIVIVRPVNASGHAEPGFTVTSAPQLLRFPIDCRFRQPSLGAVSPNIEFCFPTAASANACWKAAAAHKALCITDPRIHELVRYQLMGRFALTKLAPASRRAPLSIVLADGAHCVIRSGGAWGTPPGHPHLVGYYGCDRDGEVWAAEAAAHNGINESQPVWTVRTTHFDSGHLVTRRVARAYFVGTAHH